MHFMSSPDLRPIRLCQMVAMLVAIFAICDAGASSIDNILKTPVIDGVSISPDGKAVAYTTLSRDPSKPSAERWLWIVGTSRGSAPKKLVSGLEPRSNILEWS